MTSLATLSTRLSRYVDRRRLVDTATRLVAVPSPTGDAGAVAALLAGLLASDGFAVERPEAGYPSAPAVVVRFGGPEAGPTIQFNGHLDTVHLPFVPPRVEDGLLTGSGASDMKAGLAAAVEAIRVLRDSGAWSRGTVLLTAHDLHEAPWGDGRQLDRLIAEGLHGQAVLIPEPLCDRLPIIGCGQACWKATIRRAGPPVHEVMRPLDEPSVLAAGAELLRRLDALDANLASRVDPLAGRASVFVGQFHGGEIFNQFAGHCFLEGTRRWLPGTSRQEVEAEFRGLVASLAEESGTTVELSYRLVRDAFALDPGDRLVACFQRSFREISGSELPLGPKPFVDDGNSFSSLGRLPAITHGPRAGGQHTVEEWVEIDDLARVAHLYALTAALYCHEA